MTYFYFGISKTLFFGMQINQLPVFIGICFGLFLIGILSEFLSYFQLYLNRLSKEQSNRLATTTDVADLVARKPLQSHSLSSVAIFPAESSSHILAAVDKSYNSFEMLDTSGRSSPVSASSSRASSQISLIKSGASESPDTSSKLHTASKNNKSNSNEYDTHLDLVKYHPSNLIASLAKIYHQHDTSTATKTTFTTTRFDFVMENVCKLGEIFIGYALMLIVMTFNFWFFLSLILGYTFGYFLIYSHLEMNLYLFQRIILIYKKFKTRFT